MRPSWSVFHLTPPTPCHVDQVPQLYPFADSVAIFNAHTLAFVRALAFWEVFPSTRHTAQSVKCLTVENSMKLVGQTQYLGNFLLTPHRWSRPWATVSSLGLSQALGTTTGESILLFSCPETSTSLLSIAYLVIPHILHLSLSSTQLL